MAMATSGEEMADLAYGVLAKIKAGQSARVPRKDMYKATTFFESVGDQLLKDGHIEGAVQCLQDANIVCTENFKTHGHTEAGRKKASDLINKIGVCYSVLRIQDAAMFHFHLAYETDPENVRAAHNLAITMLNVGALNQCTAILESVLLRRPRTSMHEDFEKTYYELNMARAVVQQCLGLDEDDTDEDTYGATGMDMQLQDSARPKEREEACASLVEVEGAAAAKPRQHSRRRSRSRSRSTSESSQQRNTFPLAMPPKLSKKEQAKQDRMRQKDIEMNIHKDIVAKMRKQEEKEEAKRIRRESEGEKPSHFELVPDLRHVVPGGMQKTKAESRKERSVLQQSSTKQSEVQEGGKPKATSVKEKSEVKKEVNQPKIPDSFDRKFALSMACPDCYVITGYGRKGFQYKPDLKHECEHSILMVAMKSRLPYVWVKVRPRPRTGEMKSNRQFSGQFRMCEQYPACCPCTLGEARCTFCHNEEEREIWRMDMKDANFTLGTLIAQQKKWATDNDSNAKLKSKVCAHNQGPVPPTNGPYQNVLELNCPFQLEKVCGSCWQLFGSMVKQKGNNCNTTGVQHKWDSHSAYLLKPENELIRTFADTRRNLCRYYTSRGSCSYGNACNFIHGQAEHKVYKWMVGNRITSLDQLVALSTAKTASKQSTNHQKQEVTASPTALDRDGSGVSSSSPSKPSWFCKVCNENFTTQLDFDKHCTSRQHDKNLLTDKDRPWHYRPPPWGGDYPRLCYGVDNGTCQYAGVHDMYNQCRFAHNTMELDEWKERTNYWRFKKSIMSDPNGVFSYVHSLQDEFERVKLESDMMMQEVDGVQVEFSPQATIFVDKKDAVQSWTFSITSEKELQKVSLLLNESRLHFNLATDKKAEYCHSNQVEDGAAFLTHTDEKKHYSIKVNFHAGLFGSFRQKVIFDFGTRPLLTVTLDVEVGMEFIRDEILKLRKELPIERWTSKTHTVVPFSAATIMDQEEESLLCKYKPPDTTVFSQDSMVVHLNHNNYVHMMHKLVEMEELERTHIASRFNVAADVQLTEAIPGKEIRAPVGHLFARVPLTDEQLSEDSDTGYLMLSGSVTAWVGPSQADLSQATPVVYEAEVVSEANFGFDGRGKDYFYLCLSKRCCTSLKLKSGSICNLAVQLQIDRLPFCRMHYGLDQLPDTSIVFPDLSRYDKSSSKSKGPNVKSDFLNATQLEILQHMMKTGEAYIPPLVVYGPFGSGKTETLARATEVLVRTIPNSRILICALNDSAADLYITRHFCKSMHLKQQEILRVYSPARRKDTISEELHPYCQKTVKGQFRLPDMEAIDNHRIIVTTLATSLMLTDQNMRGRFTHILLDEAGQCLECEAILPLTLATNSTCVVLAGDHRQLGPKYFSAPTRMKLHMSILERLVLYYIHFDEQHPRGLVKLLKVNYRSHPKAMSFVSKHFYNGAIECRSDWGQHSDFKPLAFYATCGKENTDGESTSYYNISEIQEVVEQVSELYDNWPSSWGVKSPGKIAVLTPYSQQVKKVKAALTTYMPCFKDIRVSKVSDVQGEEFHAIFMTTVRTHHGIENSSAEETFGFCSNFHLVNTAMTRAKCQIAVIGDPSFLTSFGDCVNIWRAYLDWCSEDGCLYPKTFTLGEIRLQVGSLQNKRDMKNRSMSVYAVPEEAFDVADMEADEIIQQLKMKSEPAASDNGNSVRKDHHMEIIEGEEHAVYRVRESQDIGQNEVVYRRKKNKWKHLHVVDTTEDRYRRSVDESDDDDESSDEDDDDGRGNIYQDNDEDQMITLLKKDWKTYKRCIITIEGSQNMFARNLDRNDKLHTINISSRLRCNRAFDGDEVVVKVVSSSDRKSDVPQGEVLGILRKAMKVRMCICRVDPFNPCLLIPLNRGIPKMNNLMRDEKRPAGAVAIYSKNKHEGIQLKKYEPIDHTNPSSKLFLVRFLKWEAKFYSPLGIAVDVIPAPTGIEDGEAVLKLEYDLREKYQMRTKAEIDDLYKEDFCLSEQDLEGRCDYTEDLTFTIDPPDSADLDDALSVKKTQAGWLIGIHIADVSHFVPQDSNIDREARVRCLTFYQPRNPPVSMLPPRLSSDLCSLQPGKKRLGLSVLLHVDDHDYNLICPAKVTKSVVRSKHQLTYKEAQQILENQNIRTYPRDLVDSLTFLDKVAKKWRYSRLGDSSHALNPNEAVCLDAHRLVEEMMVRVNHETARKLLEEVNDTVPLRLQQRPNEESLHEWCSTHHEYARQSLSLRRAFAEVQLQRPCQCTGTCNCITNFRSNPQVSITHQLLSRLKAALDKKDDKALRNLIATSMLTPEMAVAEFAYRDIQERAEYKCSGDTETAYHVSLNLEPYLHFTSPIRRYIDIVSHRLIKTVTENTSPTYKKSDIRRVCDQCNSATLKQKRYDKEVRSLKLNVIMKEQPLVVYPVVEKVEEGRICLRFPTMSDMPFTVGALSYSHLDLQTLPIYDEQRQEVELYWEEQVYDYSRYRKESDLTASSGSKEIKLDPNRFVTQIPAVEWQQLVNRIKADDSSGLQRKVRELLVSTSWKKTNLSAGKHCAASIKLKLKVSRAQVHRVQLTSTLRQGRLTPRIQLFTLINNLDICIEHHQDPITCFAKTTGLRVTRDYACAKDYRERWVPVLKAEAASQAITHGESFFLKGVDIKWKRTEDGAIEGKLTLLTDFCEEDQAFDVGGSTSGEEQYLCVRYQGIAVSEKVLGKDIVNAAQAEDKVSLVAHCLVTVWSVDEPKKKDKHDHRTTSITMVVHQSSMPFPDLPLLADQKATIEAIAEPLPMRRMLLALTGFKKEGMAERLALGRKPPELDEEKVKRAHKESKSASIPGYVDPNSEQQHAVVKALNQSFSVIHGPPGTGKTVTGVRIAFMFAKLNKVENKQNKVLYCGPSNKSVEVVIDYLKGTKKKAYLELVRVYSEDVVQLQYPLPTKYKSPRRLESSSERENLVQECRHPDIALHKLIRDASHCPEQAGKIRGFDNAFRKETERMSQNPERFKRTKEEKAMWRREVAKYKQLVNEASGHILSRADIVLVTCVGSASPIINHYLGSNTNQVIIDEAGMCMEPEALVPLTSCDPKQVVLIGDHQQLQPIVQSEMGQRLGLKRSMFARYVKVTDMLTTQYRMHEAIAKLPSELFYDDRLKCGNPEQHLSSIHKGMWPGGPSCPIAFVDIRGEEKSQVITTADGNEQSKYNPEEAKYTANVVRALIMDRRIRPDCIQILSQYRAHCKEIREQFDRLNFKVRCDVTTVTKSQGSEVDYIVLSAVRSLPSEMIEMRPTHGWLKRCLGTISDPHQVNVAITRARKGLIIIGNRELLSASDVWRQLFDHYRRNKAIASSPPEFLRNIRMVP